ncbi:MAG: hypothetical protein F6J95_005370 [Leptolyngbya sp. SIO1E4]|nr:hypothetical protein [Leptolyngbya sp. SIO1E4]
MESNRLNRALIRILGLGWAAFAIAVLAIRIVFAAPDITLLVDRSYCEPTQWNQVVAEYERLYEQSQRGQINLQAVIFFSDLGEEKAASLPTPVTFRDLKTYGKSNPDRQAALEAAYPQSRLLTCQP